MFCSNCGSQTTQGAQYCHSCGQKLLAVATQLPTQTHTPAPTVPADARLNVLPSHHQIVRPVPQRIGLMSLGTNSVRKGTTQAKFNEDNSNILSGEIVLISIAAGFLTKSWWWFGGTLLGFIMALRIPPLAYVLMVLLSAGWAAIGYGIGMFFDSQSASIVLAVIGFAAGLGANFSGLQWTRDV